MSVFIAARLFDRLKSRCKIYEILGKDLIELVEPPGVGGVVIAMKQFERLLIVHAPFPPFFSSDIGTPGAITRPRSIALARPIQMTRAVVDAAGPLGPTITSRAGMDTRACGRRS
jgi:hypothetical protein